MRGEVTTFLFLSLYSLTLMISVSIGKKWIGNCQRRGVKMMLFDLCVTFFSMETKEEKSVGDSFVFSVSLQ